MPRSLKSFRLWTLVIALGLTGLAAMALSAEPRQPPPVLAWSHLAAI